MHENLTDKDSKLCPIGTNFSAVASKYLSILFCLRDLFLCTVIDPGSN